MGVALSYLSGKLARVQSANIEAAQKCVPFIDDEEFSVVSLNIFERAKPAKGMKPLELYAREFEAMPNVVERRDTGSERVEVQPHIEAGAGFGCERSGKASSYCVGREDVRFHSDVTLGAFDGLDHRLVKLVALGKESEAAMPFAERWHAHPGAFACDLYLPPLRAGVSIALAVSVSRPAVSVDHSARS
jgi:hypothetical protein